MYWERLDIHALPMLSTDGDPILHLVIIFVCLLSGSYSLADTENSQHALSLFLSLPPSVLPFPPLPSLSLSLILLHNTQSSGSGPLYRNLKESLGLRGARNAVPKCIIKSYQEISRPTTERGGKDATRNFVGPAIPRNRRRSNKQLFPPLSLRSSAPS